MAASIAMSYIKPHMPLYCMPEPETVQDGIDLPPDGGLRAWLVVLGSSLGTFATFGFVNAWGVFQSYYEQTLLSDTSPSTIAWIGSIQYSLVFIPGLVVGRLFDMGIFRIPLTLASAWLVMATFLVAECKTYWQFLLCQGFAVGLGSGVIFNPTLGVIPHWFQKKKGIALGVVAFGSSIGGTVFPIAVRNLIQSVGFKWTMRIIGFIILVALALTNVCVARRLPPKKNSGPFFNLHAFKNPAYTTYCLAGFVSFLGLYTVLTYIDASASFAGIDDNFSFYLVSIANAGSAIGRLASGFGADIFGPLAMMIPSTAIAGILTFIWPFMSSKSGFSAMGFFYGLSSGFFVSILAAPIVEMGETHDVGVRMGMYFTVVALGALAGPPISGAINQSTGGYKDVGYYAGSAVLLSVVLLIISRHFILHGRIWGKA
ncbi:MFS general substrate transporter [Irpex rosettiformis]|uniref:MFS general substrate transporter n=1 Tax=Irpex rosettiformis TaxID=378272 RepID=A0ACB8TVZ8_9APHY|nr:MFS general substrate transporter [Irpex rosettiformis]